MSDWLSTQRLPESKEALLYRNSTVALRTSWNSSCHRFRCFSVVELRGKPSAIALPKANQTDIQSAEAQREQGIHDSVDRFVEAKHTFHMLFPQQPKCAHLKLFARTSQQVDSDSGEFCGFSKQSLPRLVLQADFVPLED